MSPRANTVLSATIGAGALTALVIPTLILSAWAHLDLPVGRRAFADAISGFVSQHMPGSMHVEGVRSIRLPTVKVETVRFETRQGREVLRVSDVEVDIDVWASLQNAGVIMTRARVGRGDVEIIESPNGDPWIERAFSESSDDPSNAPEGEPGPGGPFWVPEDRLVMQLEDARFEGLRVRLVMSDQRATLADANGRTRIWLPGGANVQMRYWSVNGQLTTSLSVLRETPVRGLALTIDPNMRSSIYGNTRIEAYGSEMTLAGHVPAQNGEGARICLWTGGAPLASLVGIGGEIGTSLLTDVSFDMRPSEAPSPPRCPDEG